MFESKNAFSFIKKKLLSSFIKKNKIISHCEITNASNKFYTICIVPNNFTNTC